MSIKMSTALLFLLSALLVAHGRSILSEDASTDTSGQNSGNPPKPESPSYEVLNKTGAIELREYDNATWVVSIGRSRWSTDFAAVQAGFGLAKYFKGCNIEHKQINRTTPIVGTVLLPPRPPHHKNGSHPKPPPGKDGSHPRPPPGHHHHHPHGPPAVALAGFIPKAFEGKPPLPDCPHLKILHTNETKVYVHKFGGWAVSWAVKKEIGHLATALKEEGICPFKGKFFVATYNSPWKLTDRKNEIWWVKGPKHSKNHSEDASTEQDISLQQVMGLEALDVEKLFPEEFPTEQEPEDLPEGFPTDLPFPAEQLGNFDTAEIFDDFEDVVGEWDVQTGETDEQPSSAPKKAGKEAVTAVIDIA